MDGIATEAELRGVYGEPSERVRRKLLKRLDPHCRRFIAASPFLVLATASESGADCSPRGDAPGFVRVIDENSLAIPDRMGNNLIDSMRNILANPDIGLIFFIPGVNETLRVNGTARIVREPEILSGFAVGGKLPRSVMLVSVREAFLHCGKALIRSKLWDPATQIERSTFPSLGRMIADQIEGVDPVEADAWIEESYRTRLY